MNNLRKLFEGLNPSPKQEEQEEVQLYYTSHVPRNFGTNYRVDENLTEAEAQALVQEDMLINPKAQDYMLIYNKQN